MLKNSLLKKILIRMIVVPPFIIVIIFLALVLTGVALIVFILNTITRFFDDNITLLFENICSLEEKIFVWIEKNS